MSVHRIIVKRGLAPFAACAITVLLVSLPMPFRGQGAESGPPAGFAPLFNGRDLTGWKVPEGDGGHWKTLNGVIDCDAESQAKGEKSLWSEREFGDFVLQVDWRI